MWGAVGVKIQSKIKSTQYRQAAIALYLFKVDIELRHARLGGEITENLLLVLRPCLQSELGAPPVSPLGVVPDGVAGPHPGNITLDNMKSGQFWSMC